MGRPSHTRVVSSAQVRSSAGKADELAAAAEAEYEPDEIAASVAARAVERAKRSVVVARRVVAAVR